MPSLLIAISAFLRKTDMSPTRFGREAAGDPRLVHDLRNGRVVGPPLARRVMAYIEAGQ